jgi:enoyl-CoA hydratase/carnithine racemase
MVHRCAISVALLHHKIQSEDERVRRQTRSTRFFCACLPSRVSIASFAQTCSLANFCASVVPTICAINGHCFAAGFMFSLACDYRVMTDGSTRNAWMCMNESEPSRTPLPPPSGRTLTNILPVDFGANWPASFVSIARAKVSRDTTLRKIALEGHRFTPREALDADLLDDIVAGGTEAVLERAIALAKEKAIKAKSGAWGLIKSEFYRNVIDTAKRGLSPWNTAIDDLAANNRLAKL